MTDLNAEMAFLQSMQSSATDSYLPKPPSSESEPNRNNNDEEGEEEEEEEEEEDYDPSDLSYDNSAYQDPSAQNVQSSDVSRDVANASVNANDSIDINTSTPNPLSESKPYNAKQPRIIGGFVIDDDDDDDDDGDGDGDGGVDNRENGDRLEAKTVVEELGDVTGDDKTASTSLVASGRSTSRTPQSATVQEDTSTQVTLRERTVPFDESVGIVNSDEVNVTTATIPETVASTESKTTANPQPSSVPLSRGPSAQESLENSVPKARLPHDRVGILEDRIAEDPKGDIDAWLNLINEHRRRNKVDDARAVYERFLKIFPSAVSIF